MSAGDGVVFLSEDQYQRKLTQQTHILPVLVLTLCGGATFLIYTVAGAQDGGVTGFIGSGIVVGGMLGILVLTGTLVSWIVARLFGEHFGSFGELLLRTAAVICAGELIALGLASLIGPLMAMFFGLPVLLGLLIWLIGMDLFQAFVFSVVLFIIRMLISSLAILQIASAMAD